MSTPKWLFFVLLLWLFATIWSNALEPAQADLIPSSMSGNISSMSDPSLVTATGTVRVWDWVANIWKALTFDYAWFDGWIIGTILRIICVLLTIASIYFIADMIWKIRSILLGQ
jgi:hypothetical protein